LIFVNICTVFATASVALTLLMPCAAGSAQAGDNSQVLRGTLRQQSAAERSSCTGVRRTIASGSDVTLVVRTAVELGYNSCQVIRCALESTSTPEIEKKMLCEKVIRGAVEAGVQPDVITRCCADACDPAAIAAILSATMLEPNYCYFAPRPLVAPAPLPPPEPVFQRSYTPPEASPFTF
jgi:hypothetical protein